MKSLRRLSLKGLMTFEAAARHGGFTRAAGELGVTQGAVSRQVAGLEQALGVILFERKGRRVSPTADGRRLAAVLGGAFERIAEGVRELRGRRDETVLTVSMLPSFAARWFAPRIARFAARHPEFDLRISATTEMANFRDDGIDVAIRWGRGDWPGADASRLMTEWISPVCAPALAERHGPLESPRDLGRLPLLHGDILEDWPAWFRDAGMEPPPNVAQGPRFNDATSLIQAAIDGQGMALGRSVLVEGDLATGRLIAPFDHRMKVENAYWLVVPRGSAVSVNVAKLRDWLAGEITPT